MNADTVARIVAMIDDRRKRLDARWHELERGSYESAEVLSRTLELTNLKWAIIDTMDGREPLWE